MTQKLTNPDGSYFDVPDEDHVHEKINRRQTGDSIVKGWYRDANGWWKNPDPDRAWDPKPADASAL